jgi:hypothetical protein
MIRRPASLHWLRQGSVRQLRRYYQGATTSCRPSHRASLPSRGGTSTRHSFDSLPDGRVHHRGLELVTRCSGRDLVEETTGPPKFLGNLSCPFAHVLNRLRWDYWHQTRTVPQRGPWYFQSRGSHERSFEAQSHGFRTRCLRFAGGVATADARLAPGRWSGATGRAFHPQGSAERFQSCVLTSHPPFPSFAWRKEIDRGTAAAPAAHVKKRCSDDM